MARHSLILAKVLTKLTFIHINHIGRLVILMGKFHRCHISICPPSKLLFPLPQPRWGKRASYETIFFELLPQEGQTIGASACYCFLIVFLIAPTILHSMAVVETCFTCIAFQYLPLRQVFTASANGVKKSGYPRYGGVCAKKEIRGCAKYVSCGLLAPEIGV